MTIQIQKNKNRNILILCILIFCLLFTHAFLHFQHFYSDSEIANKQIELERTAKIKTESVCDKYSQMLLILDTLAQSMATVDYDDVNAVIEDLNMLANVGYFDYVGVSDPDGNMMDSQGKTENIKDRDYFQKAMQGEIIISDVLQSKIIPEDTVQVLARPIRRDNQISGIVFGIINLGQMDKLLENETGNYIYTQIVDSNGNYITQQKTTDTLMEHYNIWDDFETYTFTQSNIEEIKNNIKNKQSGKFEFSLNDQKRISYYMPLGINNYYLFSTSNSSYITNRAHIISRNIMNMILEMSVAALVLLYGLYKYNKHLNSEIKSAHQETISTSAMLKAAVEESNQYIFEYNIETRTLYKKAGTNNLLFQQDQLENVPESILQSGNIVASSLEDFSQLFNTIQHEHVAESIIEVKDHTVSHWFKIRMKNIYDEKNYLINTVGIIEDVTEKKEQEKIIKSKDIEEKTLRKKAELDGLTGLFNATTLKEKVAHILNDPLLNESTHLFLLIDLDNFKEINDSFGHQYGDRVLAGMANIIKQTFRKDDIIARLGGDEFAALLVNATNYEVMEPAFKNLCDKLSKTYTKDGKSVKVSASIGISSAPNQGSTFEELYKKSDLALYQVKKESKNGYKKYQDL